MRLRMSRNRNKNQKFKESKMKMFKEWMFPRVYNQITKDKGFPDF